MVVIILFSLTEFHEFVKIPFAIGHFIEHYSENSTTSIVDFLKEHYSTSDSHSEEHSSLPFQEHCASLVLQIVLFQDTFQNEIVLTYTKVYYQYYSNKSTELGTQIGVWQPPQSISHS